MKLAHRIFSFFKTAEIFYFTYFILLYLHACINSFLIEKQMDVKDFSLEFSEIYAYKFSSFKALGVHGSSDSSLRSQVHAATLFSSYVLEPNLNVGQYPQYFRSSP